MSLSRFVVAALFLVQFACSGGGSDDPGTSADAGPQAGGESSVALAVQWPSSFVGGVHASSFGLPSRVRSLEMTIQLLGPDFPGRVHTLSVTQTGDGDRTVWDGLEIESDGAHVTFPVPVGDPRRVYITGDADLAVSGGGTEATSFEGFTDLPAVTTEPGLRATVVLHDAADGPVVPVIETISVTPPAAVLHVGDTTALAVSAIFSDGFGALQPMVDYASSDASVAEVDADGRISIVGKGSVTVMITSGSATTPLSLLIENIPPEGATVTNLPPDDPDLPPGGSLIEVEEDGTATARVEVSDVDDTTHDLVIAVAPAHGTVTVGGDGTVTYVPDANYSGGDSFEVVVTDPDGGETRVVVTVLITPVPDPPVLDAIADQTSQEGDDVDLVVVGSDPDGDPLTYDATGLPAGLAIDALSGVISGAIDLTAAPASPYAVEVSANDGADTATQTFTWSVTGLDSDGDGTPDRVDNCPATPNAVQSDGDGDGAGDACDPCPADSAKIDPGVCGCGVADTDSDGDGTADCNDACVDDPAKIAPGVCGCGVADTDSDGDGTPDCNDACVDDPAKVAPGVCGCGVADTDGDGDGTADCNDQCPADPAKVVPGVCGCGVTDTDSDGDGTPDCNDQCADDPAKIDPGVCGCGVVDTDSDGDGTADCNDQCAADPAKVDPGVCGCGVADTDSDGDGTPDCNDQCAADPAKIDPGVCGCGVADTDSDGDGTADCNDGCVDDPAKIAPGVCGCGVADTDSDGDGTPDCNDGCVDDPAKVDPGTCGCGVADTDSDGDGTADCIDLCPADPAKIDPGVCGCGVADTDSDSDGTPDCNDLCPADPGKIDPGVCGCGVADTDSDGDGTADCIDLCAGDPAKTDPGVCGCGVADTDSDGDGTPDCNDGCVDDPAKVDPGTCGCGVADTDSDGDGTADCIDLCPADPAKIDPGVCGCGVADTDSDGDGVADCVDNCPATFNPDQADSNGNGVGDACDDPLLSDLVFADAELQACVQGSGTRVSDLTFLLCSNLGITDLGGIEALTALTELNLLFNQITDLTPLQTLTGLTGLYLAGNQIADPAPLQGLTALTALELGTNPIANLAALQGLTALTYLDLSGDLISDVTPLQGLTALNYLNLSDNQVVDISPLAELTALSSLALANNQVASVIPLQTLTNLTSLALQGNQITDVTPLQGLTALINLNLASNQLMDIPPETGFFPGDTTQVTPLADLTSLTFLNLSGNGIKDVRALSTLFNLGTLVLSDNPDLFCYEVDALATTLEGTTVTATNCAATYNLLGTVYNGSLNPAVRVGAGAVTVQVFVPGGPVIDSDATDANGLYQLIDVGATFQTINVSGLGTGFTCTFGDALVENICHWGLEETNENMDWWLCPFTACDAGSFCASIGSTHCQ